MGKLKQYLENIYNGDNLCNEKSKCIYDSTQYRLELGFKEYSRFKDPKNFSIYSPYIITTELIRSLDDHILLVKNLWELNPTKLDELIIVNNKSELVIYEPTKIIDVTFKGDLTVLGLLAIRCRKYYKNLEFKHLVEFNLKTFMNELTFMEVTYFIPKLLYDSLLSMLMDKTSLMNNEFITKLLQSNSFYWKD